MPPSVEQISIWILEALEEEWRRECDLVKCRTTAVVLGEVMAKHSLKNADIDRGLHFCIERQYIKAVNREDGQAMLPSNYGLAILAKIAKVGIEEQEKRKWSRADKISLASLIFGVITFFIGVFIGDHLSKKSDSLPSQPQQTNSITNTSPKSH
jgi:hypothetical protein